YVCVAKHTGVGSPSCQVFACKVIDDVVAKLFSDIENIVWKPKAYGNISGIIYRVETTTTCLLLARTRRSIVPCLHRHAYHFISLFVKHYGSHGTIYSSTHSHQYSSVLTHNYAFLFVLLAANAPAVKLNLIVLI